MSRRLSAFRSDLTRGRGSAAVHPVTRHPLLEAEHAAVARRFGSPGPARMGRIGEALVVVCGDVEAADVDVEVDVASLEGRRVGRPKRASRDKRSSIAVQALRPRPRPISPDAM